MRPLKRVSGRVPMAVLSCLVSAALAMPPAFAACGNGLVEPGEYCDDGGENGSTNSCCSVDCLLSDKIPDVVVGDLSDAMRYGNIGGITAYAVGTVSCNVGSCWLKWIWNTPEHPVIGQNMFRLKDGRFEQIGQSWLKHGLGALQGDFCSHDCVPSGTAARLGVNCSDPYEAQVNGYQRYLGPKLDVNPDTGVFPYIDWRFNPLGNAIYKRLQVHDADLDPALNPGALYFVEGQYVSQDDALAGNANNNASYRRATIGFAPNYELTLIETTVQGKAGIEAWKANDPSVTETIIDAPEGRFILAAKATLLGGGTYHYEYALQNLNNNRAGQSFTVPIPAGASITNVGFHDVDYHSGVQVLATDWVPTITATSVSWTSDTYAADQGANALRWGTLYNFRFDADVAPQTALITLGLFKPGSVTSVTAATVTPGPCGSAPDGTECSDGDPCTSSDACQAGACIGSQPINCAPLDACHTPGTCDSATGLCSNPASPDGTPCDDGLECTTDDVCTVGVCVAEGPLPGEVGSVGISRSDGLTIITWSMAPHSSTSAVLRGLRSQLPVGPGGDDEVCLDAAVDGTSITDVDIPPDGDVFWYLIRGRNSCGAGSYGAAAVGGSPGFPRESSTCP